jgi:hypothetical protein
MRQPLRLSIIDPSQLEQRLSAGLVSIALNAQKELCVLQKLGRVPISTDEILQVDRCRCYESIGDKPLSGGQVAGRLARRVQCQSQNFDTEGR